MKFRCERDTLVEALATAQRAVASRTGAPPVLFDVRVTATSDGLELVGSDLEITNRVQVPADVEVTGVAVLPKILGDVVRKLAAGPITVAVTDDEASVSSGDFSTTLRLKAVDEYPRLQTSDGVGAKVDASLFASALRQVVKAASKDELRPPLTGVLIAARADGTGIRMVATDSYRLALRDLDGVSMLGDTNKVLVAAKGLAEVQRLAGDGEIEVVLGDRDAVFRTRKAEVTVRLIEADFPNYEQLIPSGYPNRLVLDKAAFRDAVERVVVVGQGRDNANIKLSMSAAGGLELSVTLQDVGTSTGHVDAKFEGTDLTIAFNPQYLLDGIDAVDGNEIALETIDHLKPATLRAGEDSDFMYLLMPVRTS